jgi:hypothetical protein
MAKRRRRMFTAAESAEVWDRWQRGEGLKLIGRVLGRRHTAIFAHLKPTEASGLRRGDDHDGCSAWMTAKRSREAWPVAYRCDRLLGSFVVHPRPLVVSCIATAVIDAIALPPRTRAHGIAPCVQSSASSRGMKNGTESRARLTSRCIPHSRVPRPLAFRSCTSWRDAKASRTVSLKSTTLSNAAGSTPRSRVAPLIS